MNLRVCNPGFLTAFPHREITVEDELASKVMANDRAKQDAGWKLAQRKRYLRRQNVPQGTEMLVKPGK